MHEQQTLGTKSLLQVACDMCDPKEEEDELRNMIGVDDVSGEFIEPRLIKEGRKEEMNGFEEHGVYGYVTRKEAKEKYPDAPVIGVRWVDHDKGSPGCPNVRCRMVAQDFNGGGKKRGLIRGHAAPECSEVPVGHACLQ